MGLVSWNIVTLVNTRCSPKALILGSTVACSRAVPWFPVHCDLLKRIALCISRSKNCLLLQPLYLSANTHKQMHMKASIHASQCVRFASDPIHRLLLHIYNLPLLIMPAHSSDILCSIPAYWHSLWFFLYSSLYTYATRLCQLTFVLAAHATPHLHSPPLLCAPARCSLYSCTRRFVRYELLGCCRCHCRRCCSYYGDVARNSNKLPLPCTAAAAVASTVIVLLHSRKQLSGCSVCCTP